MQGTTEIADAPALEVGASGDWQDRLRAAAEDGVQGTRVSVHTIYLVVGSDGETIYQVRLREAFAGQRTVRCSCPAGLKGKRCKHAAYVMWREDWIEQEPRI